MGFGAPPQNPNSVFWHCAVETSQSYVSKNTFASLWGTLVWVFWAPSQNPNSIFGIVHFKHNHHRAPKTPLLACGVQGYGCLRRHPITHAILFGTVQFEHHHPRCPKTPLLACWVQWYGCLGRHPRTQTICFGTVQFKHHHERNSKTPLLACGVHCYGRLGRHPGTQTVCCGTVQFKHDHQWNSRHLWGPEVYSGMGVWGATPEPIQYFLALYNSNITILRIPK